MEPALTTQTNYSPPGGYCQENNLQAGLLPGMEASALHDTEAAQRSQRRMELGTRLACALVGYPVDLAEGEERWELVDRGTGRPLVQVGDRLHLVLDGGELGRELAPARAGYFATLLLRAALPENHLVGILDGGDEGAYVGNVPAVKFSLMLDPNYSDAKRRRSRRLAKRQMHQVMRELPPGEKALRRTGNLQRLTLKMDTYTVPPLPGLDIEAQLSFVNGAWRRFSRTDMFMETNYAGVKGLELRCLVGQGGAHIHFVNLSRFKDGFKKNDTVKPWHQAWKKALTAQATEAGITLDYGPGGLPYCDCRSLTKRVGQSRDELIEEALDEGVKYITDLDELLNQAGGVSPEALLAICEVARWPRMFELTGAARTPPAEPGPRLDTSCISVEGGVLKLVDDFWIQAREPEERSLFETLIVDTARRSGAVRENAWATDRERAEFLAKNRPRPPTWRDLIDQLPFSEWLHLMMGKARVAYRWRIAQLAQLNPTLFLVDMTGKVIIRQAPDLDPA